jgi:methylmalonyl-CoA mutase cobalamin-binding domain/chain
MKRVSRSSAVAETRATTATAARLARHPIAVVAARTGLTPDVLRVWERRYGAVKPTRSREGQRLYSDADVARLRALRNATEAGRRIGRIARLSSSALRKFIEEDSAARYQEPAPRSSPDAGALRAAALADIRALDAPALDATLHRAATLVGVAGFLDQVAAPLLRHVGEEWHAGRLSVAQEHLASHVVQAVITSCMRDLVRTNGAPRIVVATPAGERHAAGAALVGARAAAEGWNVIYLGADLPADEIAGAAIATNARAVALSVVYVADRGLLMRELRALRKGLPADVTLIVGGGAAAAMRDQLRSAGIVVAESLGTLDRLAGKR